MGLRLMRAPRIAALIHGVAIAAGTGVFAPQSRGRLSIASGGRINGYRHDRASGCLCPTHQLLRGLELIGGIELEPHRSAARLIDGFHRKGRLR